ncbi:MAG: ribonuclease P protein component [Nitrospinota bacterium]|nr:MAG: ribonuclease P protein component [Nitrospinota bacterium]
MKGKEGFTREQRLRKRRDFLACYAQGKPVYHRYFTLYLLPRDHEQVTRLGLTVSRKLGGAVVRNRIKRKVREIFRRSPLIPRTGYDLVFVAKKACLDLDYWTLESAFTEAVQQALASLPPSGSSCRETGKRVEGEAGKEEGCAAENT